MNPASNVILELALQLPLSSEVLVFITSCTECWISVFTSGILVLVHLVTRMLVNKMCKIKMQRKVKNVNLKCSGIKLFYSIYTVTKVLK